MNSIKIWDNAKYFNSAQIQETVLCISSDLLDRDDLDILSGDTYLAHDLEAFQEIVCQPHDAIIVYPQGFGIAKDLLNTGLMDAGAKIYWNLGESLTTTLQILAGVGIPEAVLVESVTHWPHGAIVATAAMKGNALDYKSFFHGVEAGLATESTTVHVEQDDKQIQLLQQKLFQTLQTIAPLLDSTPECGRSHDGAAENDLKQLKRRYEVLENELVQLNHKHEVLELRYRALANSKLGKLTLRVWSRKGARNRSRSFSAS